MALLDMEGGLNSAQGVAKSTQGVAKSTQGVAFLTQVHPDNMLILNDLQEFSASRVDFLLLMVKNVFFGQMQLFSPYTLTNSTLRAKNCFKPLFCSHLTGWTLSFTGPPWHP